MSDLDLDTNFGDTYYYKGLLVEMFVAPRWEGDTVRVRILGGRWRGPGVYQPEVGDCTDVPMKDLISIAESVKDDMG